ncbi:hypothetical protein GGS23DRAFT_242571 [Durotheca rogersii]|uniref:uncharacterized protein n=1 Tax=Durotheca rogersii TaxID=419775 RepID=UPI002220CC67|nr:uncharacterized protein GGS23DRAFT_242571 [Durotheca rogersii]KAI5860271.1 hypothetical protein GGS23DRAFT_242571 [Durotheca rogersii]
MEHGASRLDTSFASGDGNAVLYALPSTFSPWVSDEPDEDSDPNSTRSEARDTLSSPETARHFSPAAVNTNAARSPATPQATPLEHTATATTPGPVDLDMMLRPADHGMHPKTEVVITAGGPSIAPAHALAGAPRRTKFREMIAHSPARIFRKNKSPSSLNAGYEAVGEPEPPAALTEGGPDEFPMSSVSHIRQPRTEIHRSQDDEFGGGGGLEELAEKYARPPLDCRARRDVYIKRRSWAYVVLMTLSIYSTVMSGVWFVASIYQPRYGRGISSSEGWKMAPSTATLLCTLIAKSIELSFVTVFVAFLGQVLTCRAFSKSSNGVTLAEMTMRNWVIQPGSLLTYWEGIPNAAPTLLGLLTLIATLCSMFYITASDAMISPKLKFGEWESRQLEGLVKASYANPYYVQTACLTPIDRTMDVNNSGPSCLDVQYSGQSYRNLLAFLGEWHAIRENGTSTIDYLSGRPKGTHTLSDDTTMQSTWIETEFADPRSSFARYSRIINNVTLAIPHPGISAAATDPHNDILQPNDLAGVGEYSIRASVVSPAINVMCVNMAPHELSPLVYTEWPNPRTEPTNVPGRRVAVVDWANDVPVATDGEWLNRTAVDDIFRWGPQYRRRPPVFQMFPLDFNMITNTTVFFSDSVYTLIKSSTIEDFTLCEMRSWVTQKCSTEFDVSGILGSSMRAHCEDPDDANSYVRGSGNEDANDPPYLSGDWRNVADQWRLSMDLNGGIQSNNASNARIMSHLILQEPALDPLLPSIAEALAVLGSSTLVSSSLSSTYRARWDYPNVDLGPGVYEAFHVSLRTQQYTSSHIATWQAVVFYPLLGGVFLINLAGLLYLTLSRRGLVADYTEPQNLFAVAVNSPPSRALSGSCGHGPDSSEMVVPWRVGYSYAANHYFFQEMGKNERGAGRGGQYKEDGDGEAHQYHLEQSQRSPSQTGYISADRQSATSGSDLLSAHSLHRSNYHRLSGSRAWL